MSGEAENEAMVGPLTLDVTVRETFAWAVNDPASVNTTLTVKSPLVVGVQLSVAEFAVVHPVGSPV
jgi:hypothetical protein